MNTYVLRLWLPDRPGALGQVASRIGAVGGDVIGIDILERGGGSAIDELTVTLAGDELLALLIGEVQEVDGVAVEDVRRIDASRPDAGTTALELAARLTESGQRELIDVFGVGLRDLLDADWCVVMAVPDGSLLTAAGEVPDVSWLGAFLVGSRHLDGSTDGAPSDIAWANLDGCGAAVASGRAGRPFHTRERQQVALLGRVLAGLRI